MIKIKTLLILTIIFSTTFLYAQDKFTLSGYVKEAETGEELISVTIIVKEIIQDTIISKKLPIGTVTNLYGFYSLTLPKGDYVVVSSYVGYASIQEKIDLSKNVNLNIELSLETQELDQVTVTATKKDRNIESVEMSVEKLPIEKILNLPALMGEIDIMKSIQLLPGIQSGGEGSSGLYVRGGGPDQNLILLDEAPVYNASHMLGFFSVFNPDAIKNLKIYKGGIPAQYGGRLSSLLDIRMKDGNSRKLAVSGGIGSISSRLTLEAPIKKDKSSFIISGRRTYFDLFMRAFGDEEQKDVVLWFGDLNAKINYKIDNNNRLFFSNYMGRDVFAFGNIMKMSWGNMTSTLRWNHVFNDKIFLNTTVLFSNYDYYLEIPEGSNAFKWNAGIKDYNVKAGFTYFANPQNTIKFGANTIYHHFTPGHFVPQGEDSFFNSIEVDDSYAFEHAVYLSNEQKIGNILTLQYGLRYSIFEQIGTGTVYSYEDPNNPSNETILKDQQGNEVITTYERGEHIKSYQGFEPRISAKIKIGRASSIKTSYNRTTQYLHLVSNTNSPSPIDIWVPSSKYIKPGTADQVALGYFRNFKNNIYEASVEFYYKKMGNQIDYIDNADLFLNKHIESEIKTGEAYAKGMEFIIKKQEGDFTGWLSYTLSKTEKEIEGINRGKKYSTSYDRTHDISLTGTYKINDKWTLSANFIYATGIPANYPVGKYVIQGNIVKQYSDRNKYRIPDYHRLDLSATLTPRKNRNKKWKRSWNFSIYNIYSRKNAYSVYFRENEDNSSVGEAVKLSMFPIIPAVTYNIKF